MFLKLKNMKEISLIEIKNTVYVTQAVCSGTEIKKNTTLFLTLIFLSYRGDRFRCYSLLQISLLQTWLVETLVMKAGKHHR